jgi:amino acid transporter
LRREISLLGLVATAIAAMVGVGVNILPFMVQRYQPGIGSWVPLAYVVAAVPAILSALCYAALVSAMPRAGGSYVNVSRALNPFAGFIASFSQWFGLSMAMGVVAYFLVPVLRDLFSAIGISSAVALDQPVLRVSVSMIAIWLAWLVNLFGVRIYERSVVLMAAVTIIGPIVMAVAAIIHPTGAFSSQIGDVVPDTSLPMFSFRAFLGTAVVLFSSFIGFDAISQAAGEARRVSDLARAILIAIGGVTLYYIGFTWSVYHAVPWEAIYHSSLVHDISAPGLMAPLLPAWLGILILFSVTVAILKVLPAVMLGNSRTLYAFSADGILPKWLSRIHAKFRTPHYALLITAIAASLCVLGCNLAGDFFLGVDLLVLSMLVNFILMAIALITFPRVNPQLYRKMTFLRFRGAQLAVAIATIALLGGLLLVEVEGDLRSPTRWYLKSTTTWLVVMFGACVLFWRFWTRLRQKGLDPTTAIFAELPSE